jgi:hypothetical protein
MDMTDAEIEKAFRLHVKDSRDLGRDRLRQLIERAFDEPREVEEFARKARLCRGCGRERMLAIVDESFV